MVYTDHFSGPKNPTRAFADALAGVGLIADIVGVAALAREAGVPLSTVRSYRDRGWWVESFWIVEKLIDAAERLRLKL
jgi:hypothetical protein